MQYQYVLKQHVSITSVDERLNYISGYSNVANERFLLKYSLQFTPHALVTVRASVRISFQSE